MTASCLTLYGVLLLGVAPSLTVATREKRCLEAYTETAGKSNSLNEFLLQKELIALTSKKAPAPLTRDQMAACFGPEIADALEVPHFLARLSNGQRLPHAQAKAIFAEELADALEADNELARMAGEDPYLYRTGVPEWRLI